MSFVGAAQKRVRIWSAFAAAVALAAGLVLVTAPASFAAPVVLQPGELVVNGGAEQPATVGWTGVLARATHGVGGYPQSVIVNSSGATGGTFPGGAALFTGAGASSTASQTISLAPSAAAIDNGNVDALLSAYIGGYTTQNDRATLTYDFRDGGGATLSTVVFGPVLPADRGNVAGFVPFAETERLPVGTREVVLTITTLRFVAPANDGYVDNVSLILDAPNPVATPDDATTDQDVPVTLTPPSNDTAGTGATLVPGSVRLLDGPLEVTSLSTAQGTYAVDTTTGDVTFSPAPGYVGTTTPVPYRITDTSGQRADSTLTIVVEFVSAPSLSLVKSATPSDPLSFTLGTVVTYSFVVSNTGNIAINDIEITEDSFTGSDDLPDPVCLDTSADPGEQVVCTTTYTVTADDVALGSLDNTATASGVPADSATAVDSNPSSFAIPITAVPAMTLLKSADAAGASTAGSPVTYAFLVTNTGNVAVGTVRITEDSFSGTGGTPIASCAAGSLLPGQSMTCTATYTLTQADIDAGTVTNTATALATAASGGPVTSSTSSAVVTFVADPSFTFAKTADRVAITGAGQLVTYTFTITNTGNVTLTNPAIDEVAFSGAGTLSAVVCEPGPIAPTVELDCTATYTTVAADLDDATLSNSATAAVDDPANTTLTSALSVVAIPISVPAPPTAPQALPATGTDPGPALLMGLSALLLGLALFASSVARPRG